jgi:hypothetical protein
LFCEISLGYKENMGGLTNDGEAQKSGLLGFDFLSRLRSGGAQSLRGYLPWSFLSLDEKYGTNETEECLEVFLLYHSYLSQYLKEMPLFWGLQERNI